MKEDEQMGSENEETDEDVNKLIVHKLLQNEDDYMD